MRKGWFAVSYELFREKGLSVTDKVLLSVIVNKMGAKGCCSAGYRRLAKDLGISRWTVDRSVKLLEAEGYLIIKTGSNGQTNRYSITEKTASLFRSLDSKSVSRMLPVQKEERQQIADGSDNDEIIGIIGNRQQVATRTVSTALPSLDVDVKKKKQEKKTPRKKRGGNTSQKTREAKAARGELVTAFRESFRLRLERDYAPGPAAAGDNSRLKASFATAERCPSLVEWKRRIGNMLEHLEAEFSWKTGEPATSEPVREQVAARASIRYLLSNWSRFAVGVAVKAPTPDAGDDDEVARRDWAIMEAEREARDQAVEEPALTGGGTA